MEHLLHSVWKHKLFPLKVLQTTNGLPVEVIDPGLQNPNAFNYSKVFLFTPTFKRFLGSV